MYWLVVPLIQQDMRRRVQENAPTFSKVPMKEVQQNWNRKFQSTFDGLRLGMWKSKALEDEKAIAKKEAKVAFRAVKALIATCPDLKEKLKDHLSTATEAFAKGRVLEGGAKGMWTAYKALASMADLLQMSGKEDTCAFDHLTSASSSVLGVYQLLKAYKPSKQPFALLLDNCTAHSLTNSKGKMRNIIPLLQVRFCWIQRALPVGVVLSGHSHMWCCAENSCATPWS